MGYYYYMVLGVSIASSISTSLYGLLKLKKLDSLLILFFCLVATSFLADVYNVASIVYYQINEKYIFQIHANFFYRLIEAVLLLAIFQKLLKLNIRIITFIQFIIIFYFCFFYADFGALYIDTTAIRIFNSVCFILLSLAYLIKYLINLESANPLDDYKFYAVSAILIYFSGIVFIVMFYYQLLNKNPNTANVSWAFQNLFVVLRNGLFGLSIYKFIKIEKSDR